MQAGNIADDQQALVVAIGRDAVLQHIGRIDGRGAHERFIVVLVFKIADKLLIKQHFCHDLAAVFWHAQAKNALRGVVPSVQLAVIVN